MNTQTPNPGYALDADAKLTLLVAAAQAAAEGDSSDDEIDALRTALDFALSMLGRHDLSGS